MRVFALRFFGLLAVGLSGCGSGETIQGRLSCLGEEGHEVTPEGVTIKIFDQEGVLDLRRRAEVELGKLLIDLMENEGGADFLDNYFSTIFSIIDSAPLLSLLIAWIMAC